MKTASQIIDLIDNVMSNFLIQSLSDRGELLRIRRRLSNMSLSSGDNVVVENTRTILNSIRAISARC
ncbi:MAG: hypothetical protein K9H64_01135 [Bacteroidales bacterium]|nr:hypothetical protein [Bacteroidales bacterium]MCF8454743.1 hypothetical protein [Bacteroidales bacterium]